MEGIHAPRPGRELKQKRYLGGEVHALAAEEAPAPPLLRLPGCLPPPCSFAHLGVQEPGEVRKPADARAHRGARQDLHSGTLLVEGARSKQQEGRRCSCGCRKGRAEQGLHLKRLDLSSAGGTPLAALTSYSTAQQGALQHSTAGHSAAWRSARTRSPRRWSVGPGVCLCSGGGSGGAAPRRWDRAPGPLCLPGAGAGRGRAGREQTDSALPCSQRMERGKREEGRVTAGRSERRQQRGVGHWEEPSKRCGVWGVARSPR